MGIDPGEARIGLAVSDELQLCANPLKVLPSRGEDEDVAAILKSAEELGVVELVIGLPLNMDGTESPASASARHLAKCLESAGSLPVFLWDERLSTVAVERVLIEGGVRRAKRKAIVDKVAATYILQGYLDAKKYREGATRE